MSAKHRIIIDTDPVRCKGRLFGVEPTVLTLVQGIDDVLAMLLAFSARSEDLEVLMISVTFGNVDAQK
jgi:inosine-uridine nucleoside N-ribohydrolase